jgi:PHD/YefM family antitoxin component YafN of YafNO toxin-antitoxin module
LVFHLPISNFQNEEGEMMRRISLKQAKRDFEKLAEEIWHSKDRLLIERDGLPIAVLLSMDDFENLMETVGELSDSRHLASIREARAEYRRGEVDTLEAPYTIIKDADRMSFQVVIELRDKQGAQMVLQAIDAHKTRLRAGIERTRRRLAQFEQRYGVDTARFLREMAAEDLEGGDLEYVEWAGEAKLLEGLEAELAELEYARYHLP